MQKARVNAAEIVSKHAGGAEGKRSKLRDCAAVSLLSLIPPDRVGLIRCAMRARCSLCSCGSASFCVPLRALA